MIGDLDDQADNLETHSAIAGAVYGALFSAPIWAAAAIAAYVVAR